MECKWHPGQEAYLTCLNCGGQFCRECISETNETYYCPDCHLERVDSLASQMGSRPVKERGKARKPAPVREPARPAVKETGKKRGRGAPPAEPFLPPVREPAAAAPPPTVTPVAPAPPQAYVPPVAPALPQAPAPPQETAPPAGITVPPVRQETFNEPRAAEPTPVFEEPPAAQPTPIPDAPHENAWVVPAEPPPSSESAAPPVIPAAPLEAVAPPVPVPLPEPEAPAVPAPSAGRRRKEAGKLRKPARKTSKRGAEEPAVPEEQAVPSGPAPTLSADEKAAFWGDRKGRRRAGRRELGEPLPPIDVPLELDAAAGTATPARVVEAGQQEPSVTVDPPDDDLLKDEYAPRLRGKTAGKERRKKAKPVVALQLPDEYEGALTGQPSYLKAVLFGLLTAVLLAGAYAGFEWWRHSGRWIFGWVIGFAVGIVVVFASGRHFNWKLGLLSTGLAWFSLCLGQLAFSMLDVRFNKLIPLKLPIMNLLNNAAKELGKAFGSLWIVLFLITGLVAFLISFRPWPVSFKMPEQAGESGEPGAVPQENGSAISPGSTPPWA